MILRIAVALAAVASAVVSVNVPANSEQSEANAKAAEKNVDWPVYGGSPENNHYSSLVQINRANVKQLAVAWSFDTDEEGGLQTSPIIVNGVLYGITPTQKVFALDAATGKPFPTFGKQGHIDLRENLGRQPTKSQSIYLTSPGIVYKDLVIV